MIALIVALSFVSLFNSDYSHMHTFHLQPIESDGDTFLRSFAFASFVSDSRIVLADHQHRVVCLDYRDGKFQTVWTLADMRRPTQWRVNTELQKLFVVLNEWPGSNEIQLKVVDLNEGAIESSLSRHELETVFERSGLMRIRVAVAQEIVCVVGFFEQGVHCYLLDANSLRVLSHFDVDYFPMHLEISSDGRLIVLLDSLRRFQIIDLVSQNTVHETNTNEALDSIDGIDGIDGWSTITTGSPYVSQLAFYDNQKLVVHETNCWGPRNVKLIDPLTDEVASFPGEINGHLAVNVEAGHILIAGNSRSLRVFGNDGVLLNTIPIIENRLASSQEPIDCKRIDVAIASAQNWTVDVSWLQELDVHAAEKLAEWGHGTRGLRSLNISGIRALDEKAAAKLAQWGRSDWNPYFLYLNGLHTLELAAAQQLALWGEGEPGSRALHLNGIESLEPEVALELARWGNGESGARYLNIGGDAILNSPMFETLMDWGKGEKGDRTLCLHGILTISETAAERLATWGSGDPGVRTLRIDGHYTLDPASAGKLARWGKGDPTARRLALGRIQFFERAAATALTKWGQGESGVRSLQLDELQMLDSALAETLAEWSRGDTALRRLMLDGIENLDIETARQLAKWGHGDSGDRKLGLEGLQFLDERTVMKLAEWGRGESGGRALNLYGLQSLDEITSAVLVEWQQDEAGKRVIDLHPKAWEVIEVERRR